VMRASRAEDLVEITRIYRRGNVPEGEAAA
jgi:hypothetical protein